MGQKLHPPPGSDRKIKTSVMDVVHPTYEAWVDEWEYLINAYEGGQDYLRDNYLHKHERESDEGYRGRKDRAYYLNYVKLVINLWKAYMVKSPPNRIIKDEQYLMFLNDVDLKQHTADEFWLGRVFPLLEAVGMVHLVMTSNVPETVDSSKIVSLKDQIDAGITDVIVLKLPTKMINWKKNIDGSYEWCVFKNIYIEQSTWDGPQKEVVDYTIFTRTQEITVDEAGKPKKTINHDLGFVPVVTVTGVQSEQWPDLGMAGMYDVAIINKEVYNISSLIQEFLYKQCFNFLATPESLLTDEKGKIKIGSTGALPIIDSVVPQYVSPPIDPAEFLQGERDKLIQEMYRHSILRDKAIERNDPASGIAKAYDFNETGNFLSNKIKALEDGENAITKMYCKKHGIELPKEKPVQYPIDYDVSEMNEALTNATEIFKLNVSKKLNQEVAKNLAKKVLPNASKEIMGEIIKEISSYNPASDELFRASFAKEQVADKGTLGEKKLQTGGTITQKNFNRG